MVCNRNENDTEAETDMTNTTYYDRLRVAIRLLFPGLFAAAFGPFPPLGFPRPALPASKLSVDDLVFCFDRFLGPPNPNF